MRKKRRAKKKKSIKLYIFFTLFVMLFTLIIFIETNIFFGASMNFLRKTDAIIVIGSDINGDASGQILQSRIDEAYELYSSGYGRYIIATGGNDYGQNITRAEYIYNRLIEHGVSKDNIFLDKNSKNVYDNLKNSKEILLRKGLNDAVVVSNYYNLFRILSFGKLLNFNIVVQKAEMPNDTKLNFFNNVNEVFLVLKFYVCNYAGFYS